MVTQLKNVLIIDGISVQNMKTLYRIISSQCQIGSIYPSQISGSMSYVFCFLIDMTDFYDSKILLYLQWILWLQNLHQDL